MGKESLALPLGENVVHAIGVDGLCCFVGFSRYYWYASCLLVAASP